MEMRLKQFLAAGAAMTLGLCGTSTLHADEARGAVKTGDIKGEADVTINRDQTDKADDGTVRETNKASKLVGMDVKNQANEDIGTVNDIVLDLNSGRVSYVVLSVGGFLGVGEKYIAVPPSAFMAATNGGNTLVLNVDKQRVQQAPGFSKSEWPDINHPNWGAAADWGSTNTVRIDPNASQKGTSQLTDPAPDQNTDTPEIDRSKGTSDQQQQKNRQ